jgi:hypothetical protein
MLNSYPQEDAQQILQLAIARQAESEALTRAQLVEIAEEMDIDPEMLRSAEQEWLTRQNESKERQAFDHYRQSQFQQQLTRYTIVNIFLVALDLSTHPNLSWSLYVVLGWGLAVALKGWRAYCRTGEDYEQEFRRWSRQQQLKHTVTTLLDRWIKA